MLAGTIAAIVAYDAYIIKRYGYESSVSYLVYHTFRKYPSLSFASGHVSGHLLWPQFRNELGDG